MNVLIVSSLDRGGPVEQSLVLARGLTELGVSVRTTCANDAIAARMEAAGANAEVLPQHPGFDLHAAGRLWKRMRVVDVVHAQDRRSGLWTRLVPALPKIARVYTLHGLPDAYMPAPLGAPHPPLRDRLAYEGIDALLCRRADAVIAPSRALADAFVERLRFPAARITVIPNGVDVRSAAMPRGAEVGTLSLLDPVKDIGTFLGAARLLARDHPGLRFVVFGDGPERAALIARAAELGLGDRVSFPGMVERDLALQRLAVLVLPSIFENSPMALLEAMAAGIPVVASRAGGIPELAGDDTALLVSPRDERGFAAAIGRLVDDPGFADARAAGGRARVAEHYSGAINAGATLALYEQVVAKQRRA